MTTGGWHAVDAGGSDLATGRSPRGRGAASPAAALAAAPVASWPLSLVHGDGDGGGIDMAGALGPGGGRVVALLEALVAGPWPSGAHRSPVSEAQARTTPAGVVALPLSLVTVPLAMEAAASVDPAWLSSVDHRRAAARRALVAAGRSAEMEAALHVAMLLATERFDPADDDDVDAHVVSGARLWLLTGAVASALAGPHPDPFDGWGRLVVGGWWPVGPSSGRLVLCAVDDVGGP